MQSNSTAEELRAAALSQVREGRIEDALATFDAAMACAGSDELQELIAINKADAMIAIGQSGPEVEALPQIILSRRNLRHVYLAAYALQYKYHLEKNLKRTISYAQVALRAAQEAGEASWERVVHLELANAYVEDSRIADAAESYARVLCIANESTQNRDLLLSQGYALEGLGYCRMVQGDVESGLEMVQVALEGFTTPFERAEALIDLCYGYLQSGNLEQARAHGEQALALAEDPRHLRNAHYLLGDTAVAAGDTDLADHHYGELARFYPDFQNLKQLLMVLDVRSLVNLKL